MANNEYPPEPPTVEQVSTEPFDSSNRRIAHRLELREGSKHLGNVSTLFNYRELIDIIVIVI